MQILFFIIGLIIGLISTAVVYFILQKRMQELKKDAEEIISLKATNQSIQSRLDYFQKEMQENKSMIENKNVEIQDYIQKYALEKTRNEALEDKLETQKQEVANLHQELNKEFKILANEILEEDRKSVV